MKILIGADIVPTKTNYSLFEEGNVQALLGDELNCALQDADYLILNLEVPLTDVASPVTKCGPNLIAPTSTIFGLKAINPFFFTLANNHILDQGEQGLYSTMSLLRENDISYAGAGQNLEEASKPFVFEKEGIKVGIYCCAEHEFSIATNKSAGANPFDPLETPDHIQQLKAQCDYVIVLYHGGKEHYRYPSPLLQKTCRKFVEKGANLVICQHTHCIGCEEKYHNATIVYGQGNFLFDNSESEFWQTGLLIEVDILCDNSDIHYLPVCKKGSVVTLADDAATKEIMDNFESRTVEIQQPGFVEKEYQVLASRSYTTIMRVLLGKCGGSFWFRALNKFTHGKYIKKYVVANYDSKEKMILRNRVECEAWRELLSEVLRF